MIQNLSQSQKLSISRIYVLLEASPAAFSVFFSASVVPTHVEVTFPRLSRHERRRTLSVNGPYQADDGKAVGLLLAEFARRDGEFAVDRAAINAANREKAQIRRRKERAARKAAASLAFPWLE